MNYVDRIPESPFYSLFYRLYSLFVKKIWQKMHMNNKLAFVYPPNKQLSLKHRQANRIFRKLNLKQINQERCQCCGKYVGQQSDAACFCYDPYHQLQFLGAGVPLLFSFMRNMSILILIFIAIVAINAFLSNILDNSCSNQSLDCKPGIFSRLSISNKLLDADSLSVQIYLTFLMTGVWAIINQYIIYRLRKTEFEADYYIQSPSDYAILISQLPLSANEFDIEAMIKKRNGELKEEDQKATRNLKIKNILLPKKLDQYHEEQIKQEEQFMKQIKRNREDTFQKAEIPLSKEIARVAIVVFQQQKSKEFFLEKSTISTEIKSLFCNWGVQMSQFLVRKQNVVIHRAPEPDDIIWPNLGKSPKVIIIRKIITNFFGIVLLLANGVIQYLLALWQVNQPESNRSNIALFSSIIVTFVNYLITIYFIWATKKEGNLTSTTQSQSLTIKIVYFQYINSGIFYILSNALAVNFDTNNLVIIFSQKVTTFMLINAFSQPIISFIIDYFELTSFFDRLLFEKEIAYYTQKDCNEIYELSDCQIPFKYAFIVRTLWLTFFFAPFVPIVAIFSFFGIVLYYCVCKILFRYSYKIPQIRSNQINTSSLWLTYSAPLSLNLGQFLIFLFINARVDVELGFAVEVAVYISLSFSILWTIIPWYEINSHLFKFKESTNEKYSQNAYKFEVTYEMIDPFYNGERTVQRDSHFVRTKYKDTRHSVPISSLPALNEVIGTLPCMVTDPCLPYSDRNLMSTQ